MKKVILTTVLLIVGTALSFAQSYDKVGLSYDHTQYYSEVKVGSLSANSTQNLNGVGFNYLHGFGVFQNVYVETGGSLIFQGGTEEKTKMQNLNATIPVNLVYALPITNGVTIDPFAGINGKLNIITRTKTGDGEWKSCFDGDDSYNRFQMGWQVGLRLNYDNYFLSAQYYSDFIPAYDRSTTIYTITTKTKVTSSGVKITLGMAF